jgi:hypothetical protein
MADREGRGGGAGWFVVGLLIGIVGTLITQMIVQSGAEHGHGEPAVNSSLPAASSQPVSSAKPKLAAHQGGLSGARAASAAAADQSPSDVADDAAAAGMTSRTPPGANSQ